MTEKKVDESWKEEVAREKGKTGPGPEPPAENTGSLSFPAFLSSLGYQVLIHLGEIPHPETKELHPDLAAAKETIDLLLLLQTKTQGNRTPEENQLLGRLIPELQMKFVQKAGASAG